MYGSCQLFSCIVVVDSGYDTKLFYIKGKNPSSLRGSFARAFKLF